MARSRQTLPARRSTLKVFAPLYTGTGLVTPIDSHSDSAPDKLVFRTLNHTKLPPFLPCGQQRRCGEALPADGAGAGLADQGLRADAD